MTTEPLTDAERTRVLTAISEGVFRDKDTPNWHAEERERMDESLRALLDLWENTNVEVRDMVMYALAVRAGIEPTAVTEAFDLGVVIRDERESIRGRRGPAIPGLPEAVETLFAVWVERGGSPTIGNLSRSRDAGKEVYPACNFIAPHLLELFPDARAFGALDERQRLGEAQRKADTQLRKLRRTNRAIRSPNAVAK